MIGETMSIVAGIDVGTQSSKVIVYNTNTKKIIGKGSAPHDLISGQDGTREQKAQWWIDAIQIAFSQIDSKVRSKIEAVGVSGQQHGFVPIDKEGKVLYNAKLWNDTSTVKECQGLTDRFGGEKKLLAGPGNLILAGYTLGKIEWLKNHKPDIYSKLATVLLPHDYVNFYLTGEKTMEFGDASGTALLDIKTRTWNKKLISILDPDKGLSLFPKLIKANAVAGRVTAAAAKYFGIPQNIPVSSGGGDNMMGAIGTGTTESGFLTMSMGTSGTLYGYSDEPVIDKEGGLAAFCSSTGGWLPLLCTMNCTVASEQARGLFGRDLKTLAKKAELANPGSDGVITLPFYNGERTPNLPNASASVMGLDMTNAKEENVLRSSMESAVFAMKTGLESFERLGFKAKEIRLIGGGAKSPLWRQMAADILGVTIKVPIHEEAAALGAALQALWCLESLSNPNSDIRKITKEHVACDEKAVHHPDKSKKAIYDKTYAKYTAYVNALAPLYK